MPVCWGCCHGHLVKGTITPVRFPLQGSLEMQGGSRVKGRGAWHWHCCGTTAHLDLSFPCHQQPALAPAKGCWTLWKFLQGQKQRLSSPLFPMAGEAWLTGRAHPRRGWARQLPPQVQGKPAGQAARCHPARRQREGGERGSSLELGAAGPCGPQCGTPRAGLMNNPG